MPAVEWVEDGPGSGEDAEVDDDDGVGANDAATEAGCGPIALTRFSIHACCSGVNRPSLSGSLMLTDLKARGRGVGTFAGSVSKAKSSKYSGSVMDSGGTVIELERFGSEIGVAIQQIN